jgi:hypothetical protein
MATSSSGSPNAGRGADLAIFTGIWTHSSLSIALERVTIKRFMLARAAAAAVAPRAGGAGSRTATHAWNGRSTAPFAAECQSFLDNG